MLVTFPSEAAARTPHFYLMNWFRVSPASASGHPEPPARGQVQLFPRDGQESPGVGIPRDSSLASPSFPCPPRPPGSASTRWFHSWPCLGRGQCAALRPPRKL